MSGSSETGNEQRRGRKRKAAEGGEEEKAWLARLAAIRRGRGKRGEGGGGSGPQNDVRGVVSLVSSDAPSSTDVAGAGADTAVRSRPPLAPTPSRTVSAPSPVTARKVVDPGKEVDGSGSGGGVPNAVCIRSVEEPSTDPSGAGVDTTVNIQPPLPPPSPIMLHAVEPSLGLGGSGGSPADPTSLGDSVDIDAVAKNGAKAGGYGRGETLHANLVLSPTVRARVDFPSSLYLGPSSEHDAGRPETLSDTSPPLSPSLRPSSISLDSPTICASPLLDRIIPNPVTPNESYIPSSSPILGPYETASNDTEADAPGAVSQPVPAATTIGDSARSTPP
ncbi:hypothetical protein HK104_006002, partial [Borealophlyctis nickersoniae]